MDIDKIEDYLRDMTSQVDMASGLIVEQVGKMTISNDTYAPSAVAQPLNHLQASKRAIMNIRKEIVKEQAKKHAQAQVTGAH